MSPAEKRRELLGDDVIDHINEVVDAAPDPTPELIEALRRIFTRPGSPKPESRPASDAA